MSADIMLCYVVYEFTCMFGTSVFKSAYNVLNIAAFSIVTDDFVDDVLVRFSSVSKACQHSRFRFMRVC